MVGAVEGDWYTPILWWLGVAAFLTLVALIFERGSY